MMLQTAQAQLAATTLTAPHDGVALTVNGQVNDEIAAGGAPFITLADTAQPLATVLVNYRDIAAIEPGETATVQVHTGGGGRHADEARWGRYAAAARVRRQPRLPGHDQH